MCVTKTDVARQEIADVIAGLAKFTPEVARSLTDSSCSLLAQELYQQRTQLRLSGSLSVVGRGSQMQLSLLREAIRLAAEQVKAKARPSSGAEEMEVVGA